MHGSKKKPKQLAAVQSKYYILMAKMKQEWEKKVQKEKPRCREADRERARAGRKIKAKRSFWQRTEPPSKQTAGEEPSVSFLVEAAERNTCYVLHTEASPKRFFFERRLSGKRKKVEVMGGGLEAGGKFCYFSSCYNISNVSGLYYS